MEFIVLESIEAVRGLSDEWKSLFDDALEPNPFVSPLWILAWWDAFSDSTWKMQFCVLRKNGTLVGVAPLYVIEEQVWGRTARVLRFWANIYSNRVSMLVSASIARDAVREFAVGLYSGLTTEWDVANLGPMILKDQTSTFLAEELRQGRTGCAILEGYESPYRDLPKSPEILEQSLSRSFRQSLRQQLRKSKRSNTLIEFTSDSKRLVEAMAISEETWQHDEGTGIHSSPKVKKFYELIAEAFANAGQLQIALLSMDDNPVAFQINVVSAHTVYNLKVGYRKSHGKSSPGIVLLHDVLCHAIEQGFQTFDFLGASDEYKLHWASGAQLHGEFFFVRRRDYWWILYLLRYATKPLIEARLPWLLNAKRWLQERRK